ncbi:MAG: hypothetical protein LBT09_07940 [Planctomycetaceae bacterium]|nr:hypothetical protein [Planctomycetaceae bacterium]
MHNRRCNAAQPTVHNRVITKPSKGRDYQIGIIVLSPLQDAETQCIASLRLLCYPAVSLRYTAGYAHFIPAGLGKKTIKIKNRCVICRFCSKK